MSLSLISCQIVGLTRITLSVRNQMSRFDIRFIDIACIIGFFDVDFGSLAAEINIPRAA